MILFLIGSILFCAGGFAIAGVAFKGDLMILFAFAGIAAFGALVVEILEILLR